MATKRPRPRNDGTTKATNPSEHELTPADVDERVSLHPHSPEDVLRKLLNGQSKSE